MVSERTTMGWKIWPQWVLATAAGAVPVLVFRPEWFGPLFCIAGLAQPILFGTLQWLVLRQWVHPVWIAVSALGYLIALMASAGPHGVPYNAGPAFHAVGAWTSFLASAFVGWSILGALQWLVLRRRVPRAGWWVLVTAVGGTAGSVVSGIMFLNAGNIVLAIDRHASALREVSASPLYGLIQDTGTVLACMIVGAITGLFLVWLLQGSLPQARVQR